MNIQRFSYRVGRMLLLVALLASYLPAQAAPLPPEGTATALHVTQETSAPEATLPVMGQPGAINPSSDLTNTRTLSRSAGIFGTTAITFTDIGAALPGVYYGSVAWGDYDNDGRIDILLSGYSPGSGYIAKVYNNNGDGTFTDIGAGLTGVYISSVVWGDYDNDGWLDILLTGATESSPYYIAKVYYNNGNGTFTDIGAELTGVGYSSVAWGDYDNDGRLDILLTGYTGSTSIAKIYHNNGDGTFTDIVAGLTGVQNGSVAWGDYDNDGWLDILLAGNLIAKVYRNNGDDTFTDIGAGLIGVYYSSVAWGDYDNDGWLDILLSGSADGSGKNHVTRVYHNNSDGTFTDIGAGLTGVGKVGPATAWGDYDNDGRLDILLTGYTGLISATIIAKIYHNNGDGTFTDIGAGLLGVAYSSIGWGDYDNDGRLDILLTGWTGSTYIAQIYHNAIPTANSSPSAPTNLRATIAGAAVTLAWDAATDGQTPAAGLAYNLRVGTTPGGAQIVAPMANVNTGFRRVPQLGNANLGLTALLKNLSPVTTTYYWSVQAIDTAWAGSAFAAEGVFGGDITPLTGLSVNGPTSGSVATAYTFTATVSPVMATLPITYEWQTADALITHHASRITDTATFSWPTPGVYPITVTASNAGGTVMGVHTVQINGRVPATDVVTTSIVLYPGANLISLPLHPENTAVAQVFQSIHGDFISVSFIEACDADNPEKTYTPGALPADNDLLYVDETMGLWIDMAITRTLIVTGIPLESPAIYLCSGSNYVGYPVLVSQPLASALQNIYGTYSTVRTYVANDPDPWKIYTPGVLPFLNDLHTMQPGHGYIISATQAGLWYPLVSLSALTITGPIVGATSLAYGFTAAVSPVTATLPITYEWQTNESYITHYASSITDTVVFSWTTPGVYPITVTAQNRGGVVSATYTVTIHAPRIVLTKSVSVGQDAAQRGLLGCQYTMIGNLPTDATFTPENLLTCVVQGPIDYVEPAIGGAKQWTGYVYVPTGGVYTFQVSVDDGVRVWIEGELVIDEWHSCSNCPYPITKTVQAGHWYSVRIYYYDVGGSANLRFRWQRPEQSSLEIIPLQYLAPTLDIYPPNTLVTYTLVYHNVTSETLPAVVIRDTLAPQLTWLSGGSYDGTTRAVSFMLGDLAPGAAGSVTFTAQLGLTAPITAGAQVVTNTASAIISGAVEARSNPVSVTILGPDLTLHKAARAGSYNPGDLVTYTLALTNTGNATATGVILTDYLPDELTLLGVYPDRGPMQSAWPMFHQNAQHTGRSVNYGPLTNTLRCSYTVGITITSSSAIALDGTVYVGADNGRLYALTPDCGYKWDYPTGDAIKSSPAIGADGTIYVGSNDNYLYALTPEGNLKWRYLTGGDVQASPTIGGDGTIYVGSYDYYLYALHPNGTIQWRFNSGGFIPAAVAIGKDGIIYFSNIFATNPNVFALYPNGTKKWGFYGGCHTAGSPAVSDTGEIYLALSCDHRHVALNPDGTVKWYYTSDATVSSPAVGLDGVIYIGIYNGSYPAVQAVYPTGTYKWRSPAVPASAYSSPAIDAASVVYIGDTGGRMYALSPVDGSLRWKYTVGTQIFSSPAIGPDGTLYFGSDNGVLYAIGPGQAGAPENSIEVSLGDVLPGETRFVTVTARISETTPIGTIITNTAVVSATSIADVVTAAVRIQVGIPATLTPALITAHTPYAYHRHTLTLANRGKTTATFAFASTSVSTSGLDWPVQFPASLAVGADLSVTFPITIIIPLAESQGVTHTLFLTATASGLSVLTATLRTSTGGEWNGTRWVGCRFDLGRSGRVNFDDVREVYAHIGGASDADLLYDYGHSGRVNFEDVQLVYAHVGVLCTP